MRYMVWICSCHRQMPEHARFGGVAGSHFAGGHVGIAPRLQDPRVFDSRLVVFAESESGGIQARRARPRDHGRRERSPRRGEPDERGQQRSQQRGSDGQGAAIGRHATLHPLRWVSSLRPVLAMYVRPYFQIRGSFPKSIQVFFLKKTSDHSGWTWIFLISCISLHEQHSMMYPIYVYLYTVNRSLILLWSCQRL